MTPSKTLSTWIVSWSQNSFLTHPSEVTPELYDHICVFRCNCDALMFCLSLNKAMFDPLIGQPRCLFVPDGSGCWRQSASAVSHICDFPLESNLSVKAWRGEAAALAPFGQHTRTQHTRADTRARAHTHLENSNFPGAEVCGIKPEPLWRKLRYSPSALRSTKTIIEPSTSTHIQMGFTTWQRVWCCLRSTRLWVGSCFIRHLCCDDNARWQSRR